MSEIFGNGVMGGGGLTNSKLALANAQAADVRSGKKFYAGDKQIKTGTLADVTQATPAITVDAAGKITASAKQAAGVVAAGTKSATKQLTVQAEKTVTPSISAQTAVASQRFTTGDVKVAAVNGIIRVTFPNGSTCTCSNGSTTLTAAGGGTATFLVPDTGTWTLSATDETLTATKTVDITETMRSANIELAFFSATISITYPAASTCVVTDSNGATVASDTNADSAAKTWTATVGATGTYTITATSASGGKTKSTTVSISTDGQAATATLSYTFDIFTSGKGMTSGFVMKTLDEDHGWSVTNEKIIWSTDPAYGGAGFWVTPAQDLSKFNTLKIDYKCNARYGDGNNTVSIGVGPDAPTSGWAGEWVAKVDAAYSTTRAVKSVDLSGITATTKYYIKIIAYGITGEIYNIWLE